MSTAPLSHDATSPLDSDEIHWALLRHLPRGFVKFLDELLGKLKEDNGGYGRWSFDIRRGEPGNFEATETYKADAWDDKAS